VLHFAPALFTHVIYRTHGSVFGVRIRWIRHPRQPAFAGLTVMGLLTILSCLYKRVHGNHPSFDDSVAVTDVAPKVPLCFNLRLISDHIQPPKSLNR
jgi:hypothetical protein